MKRIRGLGAKLPLRRDEEDGYSLVKTHHEAIRQNMKNLILTNPGERIMIPNFGAGLSRFLFEQDDPAVYDNISGAIKAQIRLFMPFVTIHEIRVANSTDMWSDRTGELIPLDQSVTQRGENEISIGIHYEVPALRVSTTLQINL